jgi:hypothetical protein
MRKIKELIYPESYNENNFRIYKGNENYLFENIGNIWNLKKGCYLNCRISNRGYKMTTIMVEGKRKCILVHRELFYLFNPEVSRDLKIDHINNDSSCNELSNLQAITQSENTKKGWSNKENAVKNICSVDLYKNNILIGNFKSVLEAAKFIKTNDENLKDKNFKTMQTELNRRLTYNSYSIIKKEDELFENYINITKENKPDYQPWSFFKGTCKHCNKVKRNSKYLLKKHASRCSEKKGILK